MNPIPPHAADRSQAPMEDSHGLVRPVLLHELPKDLDPHDPSTPR
jgi:hypothetical protein